LELILDRHLPNSGFCLSTGVKTVAKVIIETAVNAVVKK